MDEEADAQSAALATGMIGAVVRSKITPAAKINLVILCFMDVNIVSLLRLYSGRPIESGARTSDLRCPLMRGSTAIGCFFSC